MSWLKSFVSDPVGTTFSTAKNVASGTVGAIRDVTGGLAGGVENLTGLDLKNPATIAALGAGAYFMNPELFSALGAEGAAGAEAGAMASPVAAGNVAATDLGTLATTSAGQASNALPELMAGNADKAALFGAEGYGAAATPAELAAAPTATAAAEPWSLSNMGATLSNGAKDLGNYVMNNKIQSAMIGSSLYDMYAKNQMANELKKQRQAQIDQINSFYAPGSPEYTRLVEEAKRQAAAAGRPFSNEQFQAEVAGKIADRKMQALQQSQTGSNQLLGGQLSNQYGGLNTMFNNMAMYTLLKKQGYL